MNQNKKCVILEDGVLSIVSLAIGACLIYAHIHEGFPQLYACSGYIFLAIGIALVWGRGCQLIYLGRKKHARQRYEDNRPKPRPRPLSPGSIEKESHQSSDE